MMRSALAPLHWALVMLAPTAAAAEESSTFLTVGVGGVVSNDDGSPDSRSLNLSIEREIGEASLGLNGGVVRRDAALFSGDRAFPESDGFSVGGFAARKFGSIDADVFGSYGEDAFDPVAVGSPRAPLGSTVFSKSTYLTLGGSLSKQLTSEPSLRPYASLIWSQREATAELVPGGPIAPVIDATFEETGVTGSWGLQFAADVAPRLSLRIDAAGVAASNPDAVFSVASGNGRSRSGAQLFDLDGDSLWAEVGGGASINLGRVRVGVDFLIPIFTPADFIDLSVSMTYAF
jgi:hypothetical protein